MNVKVKSKANGDVIEVHEKDAAILVASGKFEAVKEKKVKDVVGE